MLYLNSKWLTENTFTQSSIKIIVPEKMSYTLVRGLPLKCMYSKKDGQWAQRDCVTR
jgi:hypothetical protein